MSTTPIPLTRAEARSLILERYFEVVNDDAGVYINLLSGEAKARYKRYAPLMSQRLGGDWVTPNVMPSAIEDAAASKALRDYLTAQGWAFIVEFQPRIKRYLATAIWGAPGMQLDEVRLFKVKHTDEFTAVALVYLAATDPSAREFVIVEEEGESGS